MSSAFLERESKYQYVIGFLSSLEESGIITKKDLRALEEVARDDVSPTFMRTFL